MSEDVIFVTAHPDDVAYAAGGTAWLLKERYRLHVICASRGERGYPPGTFPPGQFPPPSAEIAAVREREERASCELIGADLTFLDLIDGEIFPAMAACRTVAEQISRLRPRAVFTHGPFEKKDHNAVFAIAYQALCLTGRQWETELITFWQPGETYAVHAPCIHVDITPVLERKKDLIRCHASHLRGDTTVDSIVRRNQIMGEFARCEYAEAFATALPMANRRWGRSAECGRTILEL